MSSATSNRNPAVTLLAVTLIALTLVGCQPADQTGSNGQSIEEVDQASWSLQESLTHDCMEHAGFEYVERPYPGASRVLIPGTPFDLTEEGAQASGFGYVDQVLDDFTRGDSALTDPNSALLSLLDDASQDAYHLELFGVADSDVPGCRAASTQEAMLEYSSAYVEMASQGIDRVKVMEDARYLGIMADWKACMSDSGYDVVSLEEFQHEYNTRAGSLQIVEHDQEGNPTAYIDTARVAQVRQDEVDAAMATVRCLAPHRAEFELVVEDSRG